jgi:hypothetical protein
MNLLNRYLQEVARYLSRDRRQDIVAELRGNLLSQAEDREEVLGRPLTNEEWVVLLRHHGNPMVVAGQYRKDNRGLAFGIQLIGPELFPFYRMILAINVSITLLIGAVVMRAVHAPMSRMLIPLMAQFFAVTLIFILLDKGKNHILNQWDPGKLPPLKADPDSGPNAANVFGFIALALGTAWIVLTPRWPYLMLGPGALFLPALGLKPMPEWTAFYLAISILLCAQVALQFVRLFRWMPRRLARIADLGLRTMGLAIGILLLFKAPAYVTAPDENIAVWANQIFTISAIVAVAIGLWGAVSLSLSLLRERHQMLPARQH